MMILCVGGRAAPRAMSVNGLLGVTKPVKVGGAEMAGNGFASVTKDVPDHVNRAFAPFLLAAQYARQAGSDPWEFAVEITLEGNNGRQFRETGDLTFCDRTCLRQAAT